MADLPFYCQSGGDNLNAGSTTSNTALVTYTNGNWNGSNTFTPAGGANPITDGVAIGMWISGYLDGAAAPTGFIARVTGVSSTTITTSLTAQAGTPPTSGATGRTLKVGGAWLGPNGASGFPLSAFSDFGDCIDASGNRARVYMKKDATYSISAVIILAGNQWAVEGYETTPGDGGLATIDGSTNAIALLTISSSNVILENLIFSSAAASGSSAGVTLGGSRNLAKRVRVSGTRGAGISITGTWKLQSCEVWGCNTANTSNIGGFNNTGTVEMENCDAHVNTGSNVDGIYNTGTISLDNCISDSNGRHGINSTANTFTMRGGGCYGNTQHGILLSGNSLCASLTDVILSDNGTTSSHYPLNVTGTAPFVQTTNCAIFSNGNGATVITFTNPNGGKEVGTIVCTTQPFSDPANGDFTAGTDEVKGMGYGSYLQDATKYSSTTVGYPDVGIQHQEVGGASLFGGILTGGQM